MNETQKTVIRLPKDVRLAVPQMPDYANNLNKFAAVHITARVMEEVLQDRFTDEQGVGDVVAARSYAIKVGEFHMELGRTLPDYCSEYTAFPDRIEVVLGDCYSDGEVEKAVEKLAKMYLSDL